MGATACLHWDSLWGWGLKKALSKEKVSILSDIINQAAL